MTLPSAAPETVERSTPDLESPVREPAHLARPARRGWDTNLFSFDAGFGGIKWDKWDSKGRTAPVLDNAGDDAAGLSRTREGSCARGRVYTPVSRAPARSRAPFHCAHPGLLAIALTPAFSPLRCVALHCIARRWRTRRPLCSAPWSGQVSCSRSSHAFTLYPLPSWPDVFRPSMCLPSVRRVWLLEMPGTSPGMTACGSGRGRENVHPSNNNRILDIGY